MEKEETREKAIQYWVIKHKALGQKISFLYKLSDYDDREHEYT